MPASSTLPRRTFVLGAATALALPWSVRANTFPSKAITVIVPFPPGGNIDIVGRGLAAPLSQILNQSVVVDNRGGGGGSVGAAVVARAKPDGYTLLVGTPGQLVTVPQMVKTPYTGKSFQPVGLACRTNVVVVGRRNDERFASFDAIIGQAKAKPGEVSVGHPGIGTPNHLALLQLESQFGVRFNAVPYQGSAPALIDLLGGVIDLHVDQISSSMPYLKSEALRAHVVLGPEQDPSIPAVPTLTTLGHQPLDATTYTGIYAPANLNEAVLQTLSNALEKAVQDAKFVQNMKELGSIATYQPPAALQSLIDAEESIAMKMAADGRLKVD